jgi:hypothetical protein
LQPSGRFSLPEPIQRNHNRTDEIQTGEAVVDGRARGKLDYVDAGCLELTKASELDRLERELSGFPEAHVLQQPRGTTEESGLTLAVPYRQLAVDACCSDTPVDISQGGEEAKIDRARETFKGAPAFHGKL